MKFIDERQKDFMGLKTFNLFKNNILEAIMEDDGPMIRAIANSSENFNDTVIENPSALLYKQIFPYHWTGADIPSEKKVFLTMSFNLNRGPNGLNLISFTIYIFVHKDLMVIKTENSKMLRTDFIAEKIEEKLVGRRDFGLGQLMITSVFETFLNPHIPGVGITFQTEAFAARDYTND